MRRYPVKKLCAIVQVVIPLAGCQQLPSLPTLTPYRMDIQQGNVITQEMLAKLKPGMTASQVRFILGTPLVVDAFHKDRWDYVYRLEKGGRLVEHRRIVVVFKDDQLARIEGDVVAAQPGGVTEGGVRIDKPAPVPVNPANAQAPPRNKAAADAPKAESSNTAAGSGGSAPPVAAGTAVGGNAAQAKEDKPKEAEPKEEKSKEDKPADERGFFGRMLDKLGF